MFTSTDPDVYGVKVTYRNGYPDLTPYTKHTVEIDDFVSKVKKRPKNPRYDLHNEADEILAARLGVSRNVIAKFRRENNFTWHEVEDMTTTINSKFGHLGGISEALGQ